MNAYSFSAYLRSHAGFALGAVALIAVVAGIMAVTGSNASAIALVSLCEAAVRLCRACRRGFCAIASSTSSWTCSATRPNARCLSSILDEPRTLEGSIAYRALAVQGKAASDELTARSRDMKEYRDYIELWVHETKTPIASAQLALASLHGPEIGKVRSDLDRIESRVEQALYYARSATLERRLLHRGAQPCGPRAQSMPPTVPHAHRRRGLARLRHRRGARRCSPTRNGPTSSSARSWRTRRSTARRPSGSKAR